MEHPAQIGKYRIEKFLGGAMAHVYRATDTVLGRRVALKILTEAGSADAEAKTRFFMEARLASNINHENIISVYDFGEENGRPFMVMEFLEGETLRAAIKAGRAGDFERRLRIALQVGRALDYIHARKIIHRDVKPENIHIDPAGKVKMVDFGIAKPEGLQLTRAGFTLGTPYYMAPEQVLGQPLTPQADVYAFGVLVFELLTERRPVQGDKVDKIFEQILYQPIDFAPLKALNIPAGLCTLIERCTAKQPGGRPPLHEVCDAIERMLDGPHPAPALRSRPLVEVHSPTVTVAVPSASKLPSLLEKLPTAFRSPISLMLLAGAAAAAMVAAVYLVLVFTHVI